MRNSFFQALEEHCTPDIVFITGDLGFGVLNNFIKKYPNQFINAGVAEQNMTGLATGLALTGKKVFTYSIANFSTLRPLEFIRNDIAYHDLNAIVVSVGGGLAYGSLGISHHATEDLAILRSIPNMTVLAPGDTKEAYTITKKLIEENLGPVYLRIGRAGERTIHTDESIKDLEIGKALCVRKNDTSEIAIISTGGMLEVAVDVNSELNKLNKTSDVYSFHTVKPFDKEMIVKIFKKYRFIFSLEEHSIIGGLSSSVLESLIGSEINSLDKFTPFSLPSEFTSHVGDQSYLRDYYGLSAEKVLQKILQKI